MVKKYRAPKKNRAKRREIALQHKTEMEGMRVKIFRMGENSLVRNRNGNDHKQEINLVPVVKSESAIIIGRPKERG